MFFCLPSWNLRLVYHNFGTFLYRWKLFGLLQPWPKQPTVEHVDQGMSRLEIFWNHQFGDGLIFGYCQRSQKILVEHDGDLVWVSNFLSANDDMYYNCLDIYCWKCFINWLWTVHTVQRCSIHVVSTWIESFEHWMKHHEAPRKFDDLTRSDCRKKMKPEMFFGQPGAPFLGNST